MRLLALMLLSQVASPGGPIFSNPATFSSVSHAFFEFALPSGSGMGPACACATPTGNQGEELAFERASSGTCFKGSTTSIAVGDMVTCAEDEARVMYGGDGSGGLGILTERTGRNVILQSERFDNAAWNKGGTGVAAPTVTANFALAPDNTMTGDRVQIPAAGIGQESIIYQLPSETGDSGLLFIRGNGTTGALDFELNGSPTYCVRCSYNATTFTPCVVVAEAASTYFIFGNTEVRCGGGAKAAQDVIVWGAHQEASGIVGSYIKTTTEAVDRSADVPTFSLSLPTESVSSHRIVVDGVQQEFRSTAATLYGQALTASVRALTLYKNSSQYVYLGTSTTHAKFGIALDGVETALTGAESFSVGSPTALFGDYLHGATTATQRVCLDGSCSTQSTKLTLDTGDATLYIGGGPSGSQVGAVVKNVTITLSSPAAATALSSDSLSAVSNAYVLYARNTTRVVDMIGVSGATAGGCLLQWREYALGRDTRLIIECGINDIGGGSTGAAVWAAIRSYIEEAQALGVTVIATNLMPFKGHAYFTAPHETERLAFNTAMATYCGTHPALLCVDANTAVWDSGDHAALNAAFDSGDHLHMNDTGGQALADAISAVAP